MLSGGAGRAYGFDIENIMIYPITTTTTSSRTSHSSSPSSTLSESINSPLAISSRKPRTPRKRPNQTYNEAAFLLSIACPKVFSTKNITNKNKNVPSKISLTTSFPDPSDLLLPFPMTKNSRVLHRTTEKPGSGLGSGFGSNPKPEFEYRNCDSGSNSMEFDTESMLDEEVGEGIDSILGMSHSTTEKYETKNDSCSDSKTCYGYPLGLGFGGNSEFNFGMGMGMRNGIKALRNGDGGNWWSLPAVNVVNVLPPVAVAVVPVKKIPVEKKKKLLLKLNYDDVLKAWSDKGSPLPKEVSGSESPGGDIHTKLAQIDLFSENDGLREAGVIRYKEKKRTRLFPKKIRYQVKNMNADRRPKSKGRFVRKPNSPASEDT